MEVALTDRCKEFSGTASITEKSHALRQIAPEEAAAQSTTGNLIATQQVRNVGNRLAAVRHGIEGVSVAGLSFSVNSLRLGLASGDTSATPSRLGFFVSGTGSGGNRKATTQEDGFDQRTYGLTAGLDYRAGINFVYGGAFGYAKSNLDFADKGGGLDVGGSNISLYGTFYSSEKSYLEAVLAYNVQTFTSTRAINYTLNSAHVQKTAKGNSNSRLYALSLGGGYELLTQKAFAVNMSGRADYLNSRMDSYRETGADELNLAIDAQKISSIMSSLGLQISYAQSYRWGVLMSQLNGSWEHKFKGDAVLIKGSFVADQAQTTFAFKGDNPDREFFLIGLGVSAVLPGGNTSFLHYETTRGKANVSDYSVSLGLRLEFF